VVVASSVVDGLYGIGARCVRFEGCKRAKGKKAPYSRRGTHSRSYEGGLHLKLYCRSCVSVESMLNVNRIRRSIVVVVVFGKLHFIQWRCEQRGDHRSEPRTQAKPKGECAALLRKNRCRISMGVRRRRTKPKSDPRVDKICRVRGMGESEMRNI
jgi:hypothetical protein